MGLALCAGGLPFPAVRGSCGPATALSYELFSRDWAAPLAATLSSEAHNSVLSGRAALLSAGR